MNKLIILIAGLIFQSCISNNKNRDTVPEDGNEVKNITSEAGTSQIILDTLFFHKNMKGEILDKKFENGQEKLGFYKNFIALSKIDTLQTIKEEDTETEIKYLGKLKDLETNDVYHVITNFKVVGLKTMLSPRGRSEVAFVNVENSSTIVYDIDVVNFPISIKENVLYFQFDDLKAGISISGGLPPMICLPVINCH